MSNWDVRTISSEDEEKYMKPKPPRPAGTKQERKNSAAPQKKPATKLQKRLAARIEGWEKNSKPHEDIGKGLPQHKPGSYKR